MLTSISPLGERARGQRWWLTVSAYVVASTAAGAAIGAALGAVGQVALVAGPMGRPTAALGVFAAGGIVGLVLDAHRDRRRLPGPRRQVNEDWLNRYRGWVYGAGFGAQLGAAFATIVVVSAVYLVFVAAFLARSPVVGMVLGASFGAARALPVLAVHRVHDTGALRRFMGRLESRRRLADRAVRVLQASTVVAAMVLVGAAR
jgi:hypothetical protein